MNAVDLFTNTDIKLAEHAEVIRALGKRVVADIIEIGRRLIDAKDRCGHGNWTAWLDREFGWKEGTAWNFMKVADLAGKSSKFEDLNVPISGLYLLASPSTPAEVIDAVADRSADGDRLTLAEVKHMIAEATEKAIAAERQNIGELVEEAGESERVKAEGRIAVFESRLATAREAAEKAGEVECKKAEAKIAEMEEKAEKARDALEVAYAQERKNTEERIAKLLAEYDAQAEQLREAAKAEPSLTLDEVEAMVEKAVEPLKKKIEKYKERLKKEPTKTIPDPHGLISMRVRMELASLVEHMATVTPAQKIASQQIITKITDQPVLVGLSDDIKNSRLAVGWLQEFLNEVEKLK